MGEVCSTRERMFMSNFNMKTFLKWPIFFECKIKMFLFIFTLIYPNC